jgi:hypothetical protein
MYEHGSEADGISSIAYNDIFGSSSLPRLTWIL